MYEIGKLYETEQSQQSVIGNEFPVIISGASASITIYGSEQKPTTLADMQDIATGSSPFAEGVVRFNSLPRFIAFAGNADSIDIGNCRLVQGNELTVPFDADLDTYYKTITGVDFAESINNLPAKFLPRVASFNAANSDIIILDTLITIPINAVFEISFGIIIDNYTTGAVILGDNINTSNFIYLAASLGIRISHSSGVNDFNTIVLDEGVFQEIKINGDGINITVQNLTKSQTETQSANMSSISIKRISGRLGDSLLLDAFISYINLPNNNYYPTGQGNYEYDISGNNNHGTWLGTGTRFDYNENGSTYPNSNGYSLWQLAANPDIQVPFDINGLPLSLTAGVDIPIGYTKTRDVSAGGNKWNMADSLINFDPDDLGNAAIATFDRSNAIIQTPASRASLFYDAANPYIYQINEIADPRIYDTYFEAAYKDKVFGKVILDGSDLVRYDEQLNYANQKAGSDLLTVEEYCRITDIYP